MRRRACPPWGSPALTLAIAGAAYAGCFAASLLLRAYFRLRTDPAVTPSASDGAARCWSCGVELTDAEYFSWGTHCDAHCRERDGGDDGPGSFEGGAGDDDDGEVAW